MAKADYICCSVCDVKMIYDGYDDVIDAIGRMLGVKEEDTWRIECVCPECNTAGEVIFRKPKD